MYSKRTDEYEGNSIESHEMPREKWTQMFNKPKLWKYIHELKLAGLVFSRGLLRDVVYCIFADQ